MTGTPALTLVGRADCPLCHEMRATLERVLRGRDIGFVERSVDDDDELLRRYALEIPVLLLGDAEVARHRVAEAELSARLRALGVV